jgi:hypothetical protein
MNPRVVHFVAIPAEKKRVLEFTRFTNLLERRQFTSSKHLGGTWHRMCQGNGHPSAGGEP